MNNSSQLTCAPRKWGVKEFLLISYPGLVASIACALSGAGSHKSGQLDPPRWLCYLHQQCRFWWNIAELQQRRCQQLWPSGASVLALIVSVIQISSSRMKAVLWVHSRRHAWGFWFMWHCACSESWKRENLAEVSDSPTSHAWTVTASASTAAFFFRMSPVFPSQVGPDCRFPPVSVSVFHGFSCHSLPTTTRRPHFASDMLLWMHRELRESSLWTSVPLHSSGLKLTYQSRKLCSCLISYIICELGQNLSVQQTTVRS